MFHLSVVHVTSKCTWVYIKLHFKCHLSKLPGSAVTQYHELGGLQQQRCIILKFISGVWKLKVLARLSSPQRLQGENPSLPSPAFRGSPQSLTWSYINIVFDAVFTCVSIVRTLIGFRAHLYDPRGFRGSSSGQELRDMGSIPGLEDPLEEGMATHSSILAWRTPWTEETGRLQSTGLKKSRTQLM